MTTTQPKPRWLESSLPISVAMCAPAVRMVAVECYANRGEGGEWHPHDHNFTPVLALVVKQEHRYSRINTGARGETNTAPTHEEMEERGWHYQTTGLSDFDAVIQTEDFGLSEASLALSGVNMAYRLVPCPWPPEQDEERLADVVAELRDEARRKADAHRVSELPADLVLSDDSDAGVSTR